MKEKKVWHEGILHPHNSDILGGQDVYGDKVKLWVSDKICPFGLEYYSGYPKPRVKKVYESTGYCLECTYATNKDGYLCCSSNWDDDY